MARVQCWAATYAGVTYRLRDTPKYKEEFDANEFVEEVETLLRAGGGFINIPGDTGSGDIPILISAGVSLSLAIESFEDDETPD